MIHSFIYWFKDGHTIEANSQGVHRIFMANPLQKLECLAERSPVKRPNSKQSSAICRFIAGWNPHSVYQFPEWRLVIWLSNYLPVDFPRNVQILPFVGYDESSLMNCWPKKHLSSAIYLQYIYNKPYNHICVPPARSGTWFAGKTTI